MKRIKLILLLNLLIFFTSCNGQVKRIGEEPLDLSNFSFDTKPTTLIPEKYKYGHFVNYYMIPTETTDVLIQKDTTFINQFMENQKAVGIEYRQSNSSNMDVLAKYNKQKFNIISFATTLNNKIFVVCAVADEMSKKENKKFIKTLTKEYGIHKVVQSESSENLIIYEWETNDKVVRYISYFNEGETLNLEITDNNIKFLDKNSHFAGYLYIIEKKHISAIKNLNTGYFALID